MDWSIDMRTRTPIRAMLIDEAQNWERALRSGEASARADFAAWIRRSPEHLQAYLQYLSLHKELGGLDAGKQFDLDQLRAQSSGNVVPITTARIQHPAARTAGSRLRVYGFAALVASVLVILGLVFWHPRSGRNWMDYATATGEQRRIALSDGSIIELNTQSHVRVAYGTAVREVELVAGEAVFSVQHNAVRPFRVHAHASLIEDLGTEFSIYIRPDSSTTVSVLEGRVEVSPDTSASPTQDTELAHAATDRDRAAATGVAAGEEVRLDARGKLVNRVALNIAEAAAWRQHRLWFAGASLEQVAAEFNRYNLRKVQIEASPALAQKRYTATWDPYDPASFIQYLQTDSTLSVQTAGDRTVVRAR
jgi:transmembrane sensor